MPTEPRPQYSFSADLSKHPPVPENCPGMGNEGGRDYFGTSWMDDDVIWLDEAHLHSDQYLVVGPLCFWCATRQGDLELAEQWFEWIEKCGSQLLPERTP